MDLVTFLVGLVPSIPPESIRDWAFLVILIPMIARLAMLYEPYQKFRGLFPTDRRKAFTLVRRLRIPGFEEFLRHQLAIILLPGLIALPILVYSGLDQLTWEDLPSDVAALGSVGLIIWVLSEIHRANRVRKKLDEAIDDLEGVLTMIQDKLPFAKSQLSNLSRTLPALAALVNIREGFLSTRSWAESQPSEANLFPFIGALGKEISTIIHEMVKIPQDAAKTLISTISEDINDSINTKLKGWFKPYITYSNRESAILIFRSAAPSIWLGFLVWYTGIAP
jgi:hypothetical protein